MSHPISRKPLLLLIEDEESLLRDIAEIAEEEGWDIVTATSVDAALRLSEEQKTEITLVLVDYMIPSTEVAAAEVSALRKKRKESVLAWDKENRGGEPSREATEAFKARITEIDSRMEPLVDVDGGLRFLSEIAERGQGKAWNVALFTARDKEKGGLQQRAEEALKPFQFRKILWKPVDAKDMAELLNEVTGN